MHMMCFNYLGSHLGHQLLMGISPILPLPWFTAWKIVWHRLQLSTESRSRYKLNTREAWRARDPRGSIINSLQVCFLSKKLQEFHLFTPHRMTSDVLDIQRTWLWLPILANMWKLWLCRSWGSCCRRDRDEATENYPSPLLLIVHLLC